MARPSDVLDTRQVDHEKLLELLPKLANLHACAADVAHRRARHKPYKEAARRERKIAFDLANWLGDTNSYKRIIGE